MKMTTERMMAATMDPAAIPPIAPFDNPPFDGLSPRQEDERISMRVGRESLTLMRTMELHSLVNT
jgi:hypothetical protein